jgi:hypothetical protein
MLLPMISSPPGTLFKCPVTLNAEPDLPAGANQMLVGTLVHPIEESKRVYTKCTNIEKLLKFQVKQAVELPYLSGIHNGTTRFANVSLIAMLNHFFTTYGTITSVQLDANNTEMSNEWDPNTPVELLSTQIEEGQEFADEGGQPYTNQQVLNMAFNTIFCTSLFKCACCKLHKLPDAKKMWNNFKTHFATAETELEAEHNTEKARYHGVNAMLEQENLLQVESLANLANAMVTDCQAFEILTNTNNNF